MALTGLEEDRRRLNTKERLAFIHLESDVKIGSSVMVQADEKTLRKFALRLCRNISVLFHAMHGGDTCFPTQYKVG
jgi:hypothetical protein